MIVDNGEGSAWQVHLDGFLAMLDQQVQETNSQRLSILRKALFLINDENSVYTAAAAAANGNVTLLLDIIKLRLRQQTSAIQTLLCRMGRPRKLDMQKQSTDLKRLHRDASSLLAVLKSREDEKERFWRTELVTILIVISGLILQTGERLGSNSASKQHKDLLFLIESLADEIHAGASLMLAENSMNGQGLVDVHALAWLWPIYAASLTHNLDQQKAQDLHKMLYNIAEKRKMPKAAHLVGFVLSTCID